MPAEPQHSSHSAGSSSSRPGMPRSSSRGCGADALGVGEVAGVVVGGAQLDRLADGLRLVLGQQLVDVDDLGARTPRRARPTRVVGQQVAVVLHRRAAAGDVGHDRVEALVGGDRLPRASAERLLLDAGVHLQRAAAARRARARGPPSPRPTSTRTRGGVDVAEEHALDAALHERDGPALDRRLGRLDLAAAAGTRPRARRAARARASTSAAPSAPAARAWAPSFEPGHERAQPRRDA